MVDDVGFPWFFYLIFPGAVVLIGLFAAVLLWSMRRRPVAGLGLRLSPPGADGITRLLGGTWNVMIHAESVVGAMGGTFGATTGRFDLAEGTLTYRPDDASHEGWTVACTDLVAARGLARPVRLDGPMVTVHCTVSTEKINRYSKNSLKSMRELRYAREFTQALGAYGARAG